MEKIYTHTEEHHGAEQLRHIRERSVFGHVEDTRRPFSWEASAAVFDEITLGRVAPDIARLHEIFPEEEWRFSLQTATPLPTPEILEGDLVAVTQAHLIDAVDQIPRLAENMTDSTGSLLRGIIDYGLGESRNAALLKRIIYDYSNPHARLVKTWRLDMVGGERISEAQIAAAGWTPADRIASTLPHFAGSEHGPARAFIEMVKASSGKEHPTSAIFVDRGIAGYWPEWNDFRLLTHGVDPETKVFIIGNNGFDYDREEKKLYYVNSYSGLREPLDSVYSFADARRLLDPTTLPLLEAVADGAVTLEPTLNPLLNNYHLIRALLFHDNLDLSDTIAKGMANAGVEDPRRSLIEARRQTIPMALVDHANRLDLSVIGEDGKHTWEEIIGELAHVNSQADGKRKILGRKTREKLLMRVLLSHDLSKVSGGRGSSKLSDYTNDELVSVLTESAEGVRELRMYGHTTKTIVGVEPLVKHQTPPIHIYGLSEDGKIQTVELTDATQRCCPSYFRRSAGEIPERCGTVSFYSARDGRYRLGGQIYAIGAHY